MRRNAEPSLRPSGEAKPIHAVGGLGLTFCGLTLSRRIKASGDPDEVTCPRCIQVMEGRADA